MNKYDRTNRAAQNRLCKGQAEHYAALLQNRDTSGQNVSTPRHQMDDTSTPLSSDVWHATSCAWQLTSKNTTSASAG
ncbi:UNVERIFIED_CONTAM: hypothetical protein Sradi_5708800 [Sesamum radiatum]|uniref:Uncharacterized protein n=1 Tax=Sesamum radiatum TaxID=300843 RepID=A0AAW2L1F5_SESRA